MGVKGSQHEALVRFLGVVQAIMTKVTQVAREVEHTTVELSRALRAHIILAITHGVLLLGMLFMLDRMVELLDQLAVLIALVRAAGS